jgi:hypothetical protein
VVVAFIGLAFPIVKDLPAAELAPQLARLHQVRPVRCAGLGRSVIDMNASDEVPAGADSPSHRGEQLPPEEMKDEDQIIRVWLDAERPGFQVGNAGIDSHAGLLRAASQDPNGNLGKVRGRDLPSLGSEVDGVPSRAAGQFHRDPRFQRCGSSDQEWGRLSVEILTAPKGFIPVPNDS